MRARIVIIGTGTTALCLALEFARRTNPLREPVLLISGGTPELAALELCRHDLEGSGHALEARHGLRFWSGLWAATGRDPGWNACGLIYESGKEVEDSVWKRLRELGASVRKEGDRLLDEDAGTLSTEHAVSALEALAREAGAVVRKGELAKEIMVENGKVTGVRTSKGEITSTEIILAGAEAAALVPGAALVLEREERTEFCFEAKPGEDVDTDSVRGAEPVRDLFSSEELGMRGAASAFENHFEVEEPDRSEAMSRVSTDETALPEQGGKVWIMAKDKSEAELLAAAEEDSNNEHERLERRHCLWRTSDKSPVIGPVRSTQGLWVACAFGENAALFAPACAEGLAVRILNGETGWFSGQGYDPSRDELNWQSRSR
jgi:glycine/D-amino acid oxidase-like deaminating enzyme